MLTGGRARWISWGTGFSSAPRYVVIDGFAAVSENCSNGGSPLTVRKGDAFNFRIRHLLGDLGHWKRTALGHTSNWI